MNPACRRRPSRRDLLAAAAALPAAGCLSAVAIRPARAAVPETMEAAIREFAGEAAIRDGRVKLEIPALVEIRIRLATSQKLVAVARMSDGSLWQDSADVIVTLAACLDD